MPNQASRPNTLPTMTIALIGVATGLLWVGAGLAVVGYFVAGAPPLTGAMLGALPEQDGLRHLVLWQGGYQGLALMSVLGFGTAILIALGRGSTPTARRIALWLARVLIVVAIIGQGLTAALPGLVSGSIVVSTTVLLTGLPVFLAQLAFLFYAEWSLRVHT